MTTGYLALLAGLNDAPLPAAPAEEKEGEASTSATPDAAATQAVPMQEEKKEEKKDDQKDDKKKKEEAKPIPLQRAIAYSWSDFHRKAKASTIGGPDSEIFSTLINYGIWLLHQAKHTLQTASERDLDSHQKDAYKTFAQAAGVFAYVAAKAVDAPGQLSDTRANVAKSLASLALAEGQSISIDRAETSGNSPLLVAALARDTAEKFQLANDTLTSPNPTPRPDVSDKLLAYMGFKKEVYFGKAYFHHAQEFAKAEDTSAGKALRAYQTAIDRFKAAQPLLNIFYGDLEAAKATATKAFVDTNLAAAEEAYNKLKKQNDMVYFAQIPAEPESLPDSKSTLEPAEYTFPETDKKWTPEVYTNLKARRDAIDEANKAKSGCCTIL